VSVELTRSLARLAVRIGANVAEGQEVVVLAYDEAPTSSSGGPEPELLSDVDAGRAGVDHMPPTAHAFEMVSGGHVNWTFVPSPSPGVATRILGSPDVDELWKVFAPILRLDEPDPEEAWRLHIERLRERTEALAAKGLQALHFHGGGTDLHLGLNAGGAERARVQRHPARRERRVTSRSARRTRSRCPIFPRTPANAPRSDSTSPTSTRT
jgi:leucyl aminopeptidase (aminopeptidase T)